MGNLSTHEFLLSVGFVRDPSAGSPTSRSLCYDFGNFTLHVIYGVNRHFMEVALLHGVIITPRTITHVECEMPLELESWEQGLAFLAWSLDNNSPGSFVPAKYVPWLAEARRYIHLLPWEQEAAAYDARPQCSIHREWARLALRQLGLQALISADETPVIFKFDGEVLTIRCDDCLIAVAASGSAWPRQYVLPARQLRRLPRRLMYNPIWVSVWESALTIANHRYSGLREITDDPAA